MASYSQRGDQILAQVRKKQGGVVVFSESKLFPSKGEAETWAEALEKKLRKEGVAATSVRDITLGSLILTHLDYLQELRAKAGGLGRSAVQNHQYMAQEFGKLKIRDATAKVFSDFALRRRTEDDVEPSTILANLSVVSAAMHAAKHAHGLLVDTSEIDTAIAKLKESGVVAKSKEIIRLVDQAEEDALLAEYRRSNLMPQTEIDMELMYHWALALPRRVGELCRMTWDDVNHSARTIIIRDAKDPRKKIGNDQEVPLLPAAWELLKRTPKIDARILPYDSESVSAAHQRARDRIAETLLPKIKSLRFHDLRHTGITMLFWAGHPIEEVAVVSGHTNWTQLKRYTHIKPEDLHRHYDPKAAAKRQLKSVESLMPAAAKKARKTAPSA